MVSFRKAPTLGLLLAVLLMVGAMGGCSTAPPSSVDRVDFMARADSSKAWFERNVNGLDEQIDNSAGYIIFPDVAQWGILIGGGTYGRGVLCDPDGTAVGWAALNTTSAGFQVGAQGFRMLIVIETDAREREFKANRWSGTVSAMAVGITEGGSLRAPFENGLAIYEGANRGLLAGISVGLNYVRYEPFE